VALCRSLLYEALAIGFGPPAEETRRRLAEPAALESLAEAASLIDVERGTRLAERVRELARAAGPGDELDSAYSRLFGHTAHGLAPLYETEYGADDPFQKPHQLADIAGFLRAFGLALGPGAHERLDHLSCELEFLGFLARKEAFAIEAGDVAMEAATRGATRSFLRDHLGRFVPALTLRVGRQDPGGFYGALARLCRGFAESECARFGVPAGPETLCLRPTADDGVPMACGDAAVCGEQPCDTAPPAGLLGIGPGRTP
jgi:DMSO reductase family type II enzyme chaperone